MTTLTREKIVSVAGDISDAAIAEIIALGANEAELLEAVEWLADDEPMQRQADHRLHGRLAAIYAILVAEEEEKEVEAPRRS